jgi:hypothetical protein
MDKYAPYVPYIKAAGDFTMNQLKTHGKKFSDGSRGRPSYQFGGMPKRGISVGPKGKLSSVNLSSSTKKRQKTGASDVFESNQQKVLGDANTLVGNSNEPPISMRLSSNAKTPNGALNMLSHMAGKGTVSSTWNGQITSTTDKRSYIIQHFRHRLHDGVTAVDYNQSYPSDASIMLPTASNFSIGGQSVSEQPLHLHTSGQETFAPINRPAFEDMMWNLNRMKLSPTATLALTGYGVDIPNDDNPGHYSNPIMNTQILQGDIPTTSTLDTLSDKFRANSAIYSNNISSSHPTTGVGTPYIYDAVFKKGTVEYQFMNKGEGPIEIEVIVYKTKKQGLAQLPTAYSSTGLDSVLFDPIKAGYLEQRLAKFGTVNIKGRVPEANDCVEFARFPFLPHSSKIKESQLAFREERRIKFVMQSGSRRPFTISLGGDVYDPATSPNNTSQSATVIPYLDNHSYSVVIATNGCVTSREVANTAIAGDCHTESCLQYYCKYTESIAAASYRQSKNNPIFVNGFMKDLGERLRAASVPNEGVVLVPQDRQVRIGKSTTVTSTSAPATDGSSTATTVGSAAQRASCGTNAVV